MKTTTTSATTTSASTTSARVAIALVAAEIELQLALSGARQLLCAELDDADGTLEWALIFALEIGSVLHSAQARVACHNAEQLAEDRFSASCSVAYTTHEATVAHLLSAR